MQTFYWYKKYNVKKDNVNFGNMHGYIVLFGLPHSSNLQFLLLAAKGTVHTPLNLHRPIPNDLTNDSLKPRRFLTVKNGRGELCHEHLWW